MNHWIVAVAALLVAGVQAPGGTEIRALVPHGGRLYAANSYWKDTIPAPGAQILVLTDARGTWRVDHTLDVPHRFKRGGFAGSGAFYFAGYDANGTPAHGTGWIARADAEC